MDDLLITVRHHRGWWDRFISRRSPSYLAVYIYNFRICRGHWSSHWYYSKAEHAGVKAIKIDGTVPARLARRLNKMYMEWIAFARSNQQQEGTP